MKISIVYPGKNNLFYTLLASAFKECFERMGHTVLICYDLTADTDIEFIICPITYGIFTRMPNKKYVMLQMEQFPTEFHSTAWQLTKWNTTKSYLHLYDVVWDTFYEFHKGLYTEFNIPVYDFKLGYHPYFDSGLDATKDINTFFFGAISDRRKNILNTLNEFKPVITSYVTDKDRFLYVNRTKVNLNIHFTDSTLLESLRVIVFLLSNKAFVLTEDFIGDDEIKDYVFISDKEKFADHVEYFITHDKERTLFVEQRFNSFKENRILFNRILDCLQKTI